MSSRLNVNELSSQEMRRALRDKLGEKGFGDVSVARAKTMRAVKASGNLTTELVLRMALVRAGFTGWSWHPNDMIGRPDFFFRKKKVALFVDGCFWHGCRRCRSGHIPSTNYPYWSEKIAGNKKRDRKVNVALRSEGVTVMRFWEHQLKEDLAECVRRIQAALWSGR